MIYLIYYTYGFVQSIGHSSNYKLLLNIFLIDDYSCLTNTKGFYPVMSPSITGQCQIHYFDACTCNTHRWHPVSPDTSSQGYIRVTSVCGGFYSAVSGPGGVTYYQITCC